MSAPDTNLVDELQRQVERGSLFTHTALGQSALRVSELQAFLHGLTDVLLAKGVVGSDELAASIECVRAELQQRGESAGTGAVVRVDPETTGPPPSARVDCASRLHICHAACCRLDFALSVDEVEGGRVKWDLGRPYFIRHGADGGCTHLDAGTCGCSAYADRPRVCRSYDCTHDTRIWKDFDRMVLNDEWIAEHLGPQPGPRARQVLMHGSGTTTRRLGESST